MQTKRGWHEHFVGKLRVNVESIPRLPAAALRWVIDDPRAIPYVFLWRREGSETVEEAVRVALHRSGAWVEIKRWDGDLKHVQVLRRPLPRGGSYLLLGCPACYQPRRHLYGWGGWEGRRVVRLGWPCRRCAGLRYQSEGTYIPRPYRSFGSYPRPSTWDPWVFSSLENAVGSSGSGA